MIRADIGLDGPQLEAKYGEGNLHPNYTSAMWLAGPHEDPAFNGYWDWVAQALAGHVDAVAESTPAPTAIKPIADMDQFGYLIRSWHHNNMSQLAHLLEAPPGTSLSVQLEENGEMEDIELTGDITKGFTAALVIAMNIFHELPFGSIVRPDDEQPSAPE